MAAAAYRAGVRLRDERTEEVHDFRRRSGVESAELVAPKGLAGVERAALWNAAEAAEKRKDARTAREWVVALPAELSAEDRRALARELAAELVERYGVAVDVAVHRPGREGDERNHHAHLLATTRQVARDADGHLVLGAKASIELGDKDRKAKGLKGRGADEVTAIRELWARLANQALERAGKEQRIDHRSLAAQGIDRPATIHLGPKASEMERRGAATERGDHNRQVAEVISLDQERARLRAERARELEERQRQVAAAASRSPARTSTEFESSPREAREDSNPAARIAQGQELEARWGAAVAKELKTVQARAAKLEKRIATAVELKRVELVEHRKTEPKQPGTVAKAFGGRERWEAAHRAWEKIRRAIEKRLTQLRKRIELVREFVKEPFANYPTRGSRLAEKHVAKREPELAAGVREFRAWRQQEQSKQLRAEVEARSRGRGGPDRGGRGGPDFEM